MKSGVDISIVIPCLNEEKGIAFCLEEAINTIKKNNLDAEIIVVDNNSTDGTGTIASEYRRRFPNIILLEEKNVGYGSACLAGLKKASGKYLVMADGDKTYDFSLIPDFVEKLQNGSDLVIGNRFATKEIEKVMPWLHRKIGNPVLSFLVRAFFKTRIRDVNCGMRAITRKALLSLDLGTTGMEFASEMIIKAVVRNLRLGEIGIIYRERAGDSKLQSWRDGWRHLRFILSAVSRSNAFRLK